MGSLDYAAKSSVPKQDEREGRKIEREKGRGEGKERRLIKCTNMQLIVIHYLGMFSSSISKRSRKTVFKCYNVTIFWLTTIGRTFKFLSGLCFYSLRSCLVKL